MNVRPAAVSGSFYPADAMVLDQQLNDLVQPTFALGVPKAIIAPHAGLQYSGAVAGHLYGSMEAVASRITRVILLGPSHRVAFDGLALPESDAFATPLGDLELDAACCEHLAEMEGVEIRQDAHAREHSLELQLPFIQHCFKKAKLVPLVVGDASASLVAKVLKRVWGGDETLIVVSSDLSHFLDYDQAKNKDGLTCRQIETLHGGLHGDQACGCRAINGLVLLAKERGMQIRRVEYLNSGDTAGDRERVVGYGSFAIYEA
ncbi:AmmeMemoRadiSam system protein B [Ferrimonas sp.]|uniref:AmmeMemoRadiSam system protein B n=1 Tax=Ferrimonas sp. TaxID=2080861 RepID=UPI003A9311B9